MNKKMMNKWIFGVALLLFAACTQDELTEQGDTLPEGVYPLEISSVILEAEVSTQPWGADGPQTRVSENNPDRNSSKWDGNETIYVQLDNTDGIGEFKINKIDEKNITVTPVNTVYWTKRTDDVTAWYPANGEIRLDNQQDENLAYVLRATAEKASYDKSVSLNFTHQLAKIRVKLAGEKAGSVTDVKIESCTSCTNTNGTVSFDETSVGEITMYKVNENTYEANVVPGRAIERFRVNGGDWVNLSNPVTPVAGNYHEITINAENKYILINGDGTYTVDKNKPVIIRGNVTVRFKDYNATTSYNGATIKIESGSPTLIFEGTNNKIECGEAPILLAPGASVTIKGSTDKPEGSKLTVRAGNNCAGIGSGSGDNADNIPTACGNITIENITLHANGGTNTNSSGAAIGTSAWYAGSCGNITIKNSTVHAQGGQGAAAIGTGYSIYRGATCGKITIEQSKIYATVEYFNPLSVSDYAGYGACIGHGASLCNVDYTGTVGEISITTTETETEFFSNDRFKRTDDVTTGFYKAGKGSAPLPGNQVWSGVKFNGNYLATGDKNGYPDMQ